MHFVHVPTWYRNEWHCSFTSVVCKIWTQTRWTCVLPNTEMYGRLANHQRINEIYKRPSIAKRFTSTFPNRSTVLIGWEIRIWVCPALQRAVSIKINTAARSARTTRGHCIFGYNIHYKNVWWIFYSWISINITYLFVR